MVGDLPVVQTDRAASDLQRYVDLPQPVGHANQRTAEYPRLFDGDLIVADKLAPPFQRRNGYQGVD